MVPKRKRKNYEMIPISTKLTKRFFLSISEGRFLSSNVCHDSRVPIFVEEVSSLENREKQWHRIKRKRVDQRTCNVFQDRKHFERWIDRFLRDRE